VTTRRSRDGEGRGGAVEHRVVVDDAVHQHDRRTRGLDVAHEQAALHRRQVREVGDVADVLRALLEHPERVHREVRRDPGHLGHGPAHAAGREHGAPGPVGERTHVVDGPCGTLDPPGATAVVVRAGTVSWATCRAYGPGGRGVSSGVPQRCTQRASWLGSPASRCPRRRSPGAVPVVSCSRRLRGPRGRAPAGADGRRASRCGAPARLGVGPSLGSWPRLQPEEPP